MQERDTIIKEVYESARQKELTYHGCSQAVLGALAEKFSEITPSVFRAGSALAGGVARHGETCGALAAAIMALSAVVGRERLEDRDQYQKAMAHAMKLREQFREKIGHTMCAEIHKIKYGRWYRLYMPEEGSAFHEVCFKEGGCQEVCAIAAQITAEMLLNIKDGSTNSST